MTDLLSHLPLIATAFFLAGLVKGVLGLGLPTVAMGLLGSTLGPAEAAAMLLVPSFLTNLWQLLEGALFTVLLRRFGRMMVGIAVGTTAGSGLIAGNSARFATAALGVTLLVYAVMGLTKLRLRVPPGAEGWAGPLTGIATGLVTGATGVFVIPAVPYLAALDLEPDDLVQALGLSFTISTVALAAGLAWHGALPLQFLGASLLALVPALLGMALGGALRTRVKPGIFRRCFFLGLLMLGMEMVWHALA